MGFWGFGVFAQCFVIGSAAIVAAFTDATFPETAAIFALAWIGRFYGEEIYGKLKDVGNGRADLVQALIQAAQDLDSQFCDDDLGPSALAMGKLRDAYMRLK